MKIAANVISHVIGSILLSGRGPSSLLRLRSALAGYSSPCLDIILTSAAVSKPGHDGPMERVGAETSPGGRRMHGALANKRAADARARALLPTIRKLMAAGFVSQRALAKELNRRGISTARGGIWHRNTVGRTLTRLGLITNGRINNALAHRQAADARAKALASTIRALQANGFVSFKASARELN